MKYNYFTSRTQRVTVEESKGVITDAAELNHIEFAKCEMTNRNGYNIEDYFRVLGYYEKDFYIAKIKNLDNETVAISCGALNEQAAKEVGKRLQSKLPTSKLPNAPFMMYVSDEEKITEEGFDSSLVSIFDEMLSRMLEEYCRNLGIVTLFLTDEEARDIRGIAIRDDERREDYCMGNRVCEAFRNNKNENRVSFESDRMVVTVLMNCVSDEEKDSIIDTESEGMFIMESYQVLYFLIAMTNGKIVEVPFINETPDNYKFLDGYKKGNLVNVEIVFADSATGEVFAVKCIELDEECTKELAERLERQREYNLDKEECIERIALRKLEMVLAQRSL